MSIRFDKYIAPLNTGVQTLFREKYGKGEPTDGMVDAILDELRDKKYNRIIAVGGGTVIDIAKVVAVASEKDRIDDLYDNVGNLKKISSSYHCADNMRNGQRGN